jgi:integrase
MRLTIKEIERFKPDKPDVIAFADDFPGLGLRFRGKQRSWVFQWSTGVGATRKSGRLKLGVYPALSPTKAREIAEELHAKVTLGHDPAAEKRQRVADNADTLGLLIGDHLKVLKSKIKPHTFNEVARYLERYASGLHRIPLAKVDRKTVAKFLDSVAEDHGKIAANRARSALSNLFQWGMKKGRCESNVVLGTEVHDENQRDRWLNDDELRSVWNALDSDDYSDIVRLLVLTGQRRSEIADLRWSEINFDENTISLLGDRVKNGRAHQIPMSGAVRDILSARKRDGDRVFAPINSWHWPRQALIQKSGIADWTLHDLRRTCSTGMGELGIQPHAIEAVLNHVSGFRAGVAGTYNRSSYFAEKKQALGLWADHILAVVEGRKSNVTPISGRV